MRLIKWIQLNSSGRHTYSNNCDLNALQGLDHQHRIAADDAHAHGVGGGVLAVLDGVVHHQIHEGIKPAQDALDLAA